MIETLKHWWADIHDVLNYQFVELGGNSLTLNGIIKLLLVMTLVVVLERLFRSFLRRRVLPAPIFSLTFNSPSAASPYVASLLWGSSLRSGWFTCI